MCVCVREKQKVNINSKKRNNDVPHKPLKSNSLFRKRKIIISLSSFIVSLHYISFLSFSFFLLSQTQSDLIPFHLFSLTYLLLHLSALSFQLLGFLGIVFFSFNIFIVIWLRQLESLGRNKWKVEFCLSHGGMLFWDISGEFFLPLHFWDSMDKF